MREEFRDLINITCFIMVPMRKAVINPHLGLRDMNSDCTLVKSLHA